MHKLSTIYFSLGGEKRLVGNLFNDISAIIFIVEYSTLLHPQDKLYYVP